MFQDRAFLTGLFEAAVDATEPDQILSAYLPKLPKGRTVVVGAGKGAAQLAAAPARVVSLVVSDVPFDDPAQVASGLTVPDMGTREEARRLVKTWKLRFSEKIQTWLEGEEGQAPLATDRMFSGNIARVIASAHLSLEAAAETARQAGIHPVILSDAIEGEARDVGKVHAALVREIVLRDRPFQKPVVLLSGGETTVTIRGQGRGGRNTEFLLALAADTDGIDGSEDNAGAFADGGSMARLREKGVSPADLLMENDAYSAFEALGDLFVPGPTGTNVNDFRAILIR